MKHYYRCVALLAVMTGGVAVGHAVAGSDDGFATYTNARVVAVDATARTLVIRDAKGVEQKVQLDDNLAGFGDIKAGDQVILTLRTGPGWARVSSIAKGRLPRPSKVAASPSPSSLVEDSVSLARGAFGARVASLAGQADGVDRVFNQFRSACDFDAANPREDGRGWFVIWEGSIRADLSGGFCRDLLNQIVDLGEPVKAGMNAAEDVARRTLLPDDIREIQRQYRMEWDGWGLTPPKPLEQ